MAPKKGEKKAADKAEKAFKRNSVEGTGYHANTPEEIAGLIISLPKPNSKRLLKIGLKLPPKERLVFPFATIFQGFSLLPVSFRESIRDYDIHQHLIPWWKM